MSLIAVISVEGKEKMLFIWACKHSKKRWATSKFANLADRMSYYNNVCLLLRDWHDHLDEVDFEDLVVFLWGIWF